MLKLDIARQFKKDLKKIKKQGKQLQKIDTVIDLLRKEYNLPKKYRDHSLTGNWRGYREYHRIVTGKHSINLLKLFTLLFNLL